MVMVPEQKLQSVFARREFYTSLSLAFPEMNYFGRCGYCLIKIRHDRLVYQQVMVARVVNLHASGRNTHSFQSKQYIYGLFCFKLIAIQRLDDENGRSVRRLTDIIFRTFSRI